VFWVSAIDPPPRRSCELSSAFVAGVNRGRTAP